MRIFSTALLILFIITFSNLESSAQSVHPANGSITMEIPQVTAMAGSPAHLYIFSKKDGLIVFRSLGDSLRWLYTVPKISQQVNSIRSDARFAYLFEDSTGFTIVDPTKFDKDLPTIRLSSFPHDAVRWKGYLYIALGTGSLGKLSLNPMPSDASSITKVKPSLFKGQSVIDIETSNNQMFVLSKKQELFIFNKKENGVRFKKKRSLSHQVSRIFMVDGTLMGSNNKGAIFTIHKNGDLQKQWNIGEPVLQINRWKKWLIVQGKSHRLWVTNTKGKLRLWKRNGSAGNYFTISRGQLWLCQYNRVGTVDAKEVKNVAQGKFIHAKYLGGFGQTLKILPIKNKIVPYPHVLLVPIKLQTILPLKDIKLHLKTSAPGAKIRGQSLYWKPDYDNAGKQYQFKIIASTDEGKTSSTHFKVKVEPYNSPPNFVPVRPIAIPSGHWYHLTMKAKDPDANNPYLVRYLGVNLPKGASINSKTGLFRWKPRKQQVGKHEFRIIATDQYGAASYENVTIQVLGINNSGKRNPKPNKSDSTTQSLNE